MHVVRLQSENILRLIAVDITPEGNLITVGGLNDQGKSSVLNSIAMALGGAAMCPQEPIHKGEMEGKVTLNLGDLIVTRKFTRERGTCTCRPPGPLVNEVEILAYQEACQDIPAEKHQVDCGKQTFTETKSTLTVTNKEGARYPSPQAVLDRLLVNLTFDPLAFAKDDPKRQDTTLRKLVNLDVSSFEKTRTEAASRRQMLKKSHDIKQAQLLGLPEYKDAGLVEVSMDEVSKEMLLAEQYRKLAEEAEKSVDKASDEYARVERVVTSYHAEIASLRRQLDVLEGKLSLEEASLNDKQRGLEALAITAQSARAVVPDVDVIRTKLAAVEAKNTKVRANQKRVEAEAEVGALKRQVADAQKTVDEADAYKKAALEAVTFPVPGLGVSENGVTFNGLPLSQASSSEQLRISVAIGCALNPTLKVLLVRNGNLLDDAHMKLLAEQAEAADMQVWAEFVTSDVGEVSVFIEEGRVKE